jgi:cell division transport system permease protein
MTSLAYGFQEALLSLRRSGRSAAMSIGTIAVAFLALGGFLLISTNLRSVADRWASAAEMSVYLADDITDGPRDAIAEELRQHDAVMAVEFVSKPQALERFKTDFPELADVATSTSNPFPASIEVRLRTDAASAGAAEAIAQLLSERDGVVDVRYDRQWLDRLLAVMASIRIAGLLVGGVLILGAAFTVTSVVRHSLHARREELDIMQLVGAPASFIRGPAIAEGTLLGGAGALAALAALYVVFVATRAQLSAAVGAWGTAGEWSFLPVSDALTLVLSGFAVGALAGVIASRAVRD